MQVCALSEIPAIPVIQTTRRFDLDRDCIVQGTIDRDFDLGVRFAERLRVQGLKWTFSIFHRSYILALGAMASCQALCEDPPLVNSGTCHRCLLETVLEEK